MRPSSPAGPRHRLFLVAAAGNLLRHRGRSLATLAVLVAVLTPLLAAAALTEALLAAAGLQVTEGPDLLLSGDPYGRGGPLPLSLAAELRELPGVERVLPRIVSRVEREGHTFTFLAQDAAEALPGAVLAEGRAPRPGANEAVVGEGVAQALGAYPGGGLAIETGKLNVLKVVGLFGSSGPLASHNMIWSSFAAGQKLYGERGEATELGVYTRPGYAQNVLEAIGRRHAGLRLQTQPLMRSYLERGYGLRAGSFGLLWLLLLAAAVPVLAVTAGFGLRERRREVALARALGWHLGELLELSLLEDLLLAALACLSSWVLAWIWLRLLQGAGIAGVYLGGVGLVADRPPPAIFVPGPLLMAFAASAGLILVGSLLATWRAAATDPAAVLR